MMAASTGYMLLLQALRMRISSVGINSECTVNFVRNVSELHFGARNIAKYPHVFKLCNRFHFILCRLVTFIVVSEAVLLIGFSEITTIFITMLHSSAARAFIENTNWPLSDSTKALSAVNVTGHNPSLHRHYGSKPGIGPGIILNIAIWQS